MEAEGTFFNHTVGPGRKWPWSPYGPVRRQVLAVVSLSLRFLIIEASHSVWTSDHTVFASDAFSEILHDNPIFPAIGRLRRADRDTRWIVAMHTGHGEELCVGSGVFPFCDGNNLVPVDILSPLLFLR
jgi:hypothetical protein